MTFSDMSLTCAEHEYLGQDQPFQKLHPSVSRNNLQQISHTLGRCCHLFFLRLPQFGSQHVLDLRERSLPGQFSLSKKHKKRQWDHPQKCGVVLEFQFPIWTILPCEKNISQSDALQCLSIDWSFNKLSRVLTHFLHQNAHKYILITLSPRQHKVLILRTCMDGVPQADFGEIILFSYKPLVCCVLELNAQTSSTPPQAMAAVLFLSMTNFLSCPYDVVKKYLLLQKPHS